MLPKFCAMQYCLCCIVIVLFSFTEQSCTAYSIEESLQHTHHGGRQRCMFLFICLPYDDIILCDQVMPDVNSVLDHMQQFSEVRAAVIK